MEMRGRGLKLEPKLEAQEGEAETAHEAAAGESKGLETKLLSLVSYRDLFVEYFF